MLGVLLNQLQACQIKGPVLMKQTDKDKWGRSKASLIEFGLCAASDIMTFGELFQYILWTVTLYFMHYNGTPSRLITFSESNHAALIYVCITSLNAPSFA